MIKLMSLVLVLSTSAFAQTSGQVQDAELEALRVRLTAAEAALEVLDPSPEDLDAIRAEIALIAGDLLDVEADLVLLEGEVDAILVTGGGVSPVVIENLQKKDAYTYMRVSMLEYATDPSGNITACWDTGGVPDRDLGVCHCPPGSTWHPDNPDTGEHEQACRWDTPPPANTEPGPDTPPAVPPEEDPPPPIPDDGVP